MIHCVIQWLHTSLYVYLYVYYYYLCSNILWLVFLSIIFLLLLFTFWCCGRRVLCSWTLCWKRRTLARRYSYVPLYCEYKKKEVMVNRVYTVQVHLKRVSYIQYSQYILRLMCFYCCFPILILLLAPTSQHDRLCSTKSVLILLMQCMSIFGCLTSTHAGARTHNSGTISFAWIIKERCNWMNLLAKIFESIGMRFVDAQPP